MERKPPLDELDVDELDPKPELRDPELELLPEREPLELELELLPLRYELPPPGRASPSDGVRSATTIATIADASIA